MREEGVIVRLKDSLRGVGQDDEGMGYGKWVLSMCMCAWRECGSIAMACGVTDCYDSFVG